MIIPNGLPYVEFRFKRDWETRRGGWVQGKSEVSNGWISIKYCHSLRGADRYVRKVISLRQQPIMYIDLPLESRTV